MKRNGHLTVQCIIDYWGTHSDAKLFYGMPGAILSFNVVHVDVVHVDSVVTIVLLKKYTNKQKENLGILSWIRDQRTAKSRETREQLKSCETRDVAYTSRYTSGHLIPNSVIQS